MRVDGTGDKDRLRATVLARRAALPLAVREAAAARIRSALADLPEVRGARAILAYAAFGAEVDLDPWLTHLAGTGHGVFLPYVDGAELGIARVRDLAADTAPGAFGIREPRASGRRPARVDRLDLVVAPGVAFDRQGGRLGYGRGFFDRLLADLRSATAVVGVAFEAQIVPRVPLEPHDRRVQAVVTEAGVYR